MSDNASDRRQHKRLKARWLAVSIAPQPSTLSEKILGFISDKEAKVTAIDISVGGMGVLAKDQDLEIGDEVVVSIIYASQMRDDDMISIRNIKAVVRNCREFSGAIRYGLEFAQGSSKKLQPIVERMD